MRKERDARWNRSRGTSMAETAGSGLRYSPSFQLRYFVLERSLSTEARFVSSFTLGETGFEASVLLRSHAMREHAVDYSARFCCQLPVSILYIYICIHLAGLLGKNCVNRSNAFYLPSSLSISPLFQTFTTSRVIGHDVICIRVVATVFSTF